VRSQKIKYGLKTIKEDTRHTQNKNKKKKKKKPRGLVGDES